MGFAEIQAAFAANGAAPVQPAAPQAPAAPAAPVFTVPAFNPQPATFQVPAQVIPPAPAPPAQQAFAFTPPAGFVPSSTPPINPPGERAALAAPGATGAAAAVAADVVANFTQPADPSKLGPVVEAEPPKPKRGRKPKAAELAPSPSAADESTDLTADAAQIAALPHDGTSVERIVQELFARGVSSVHLTFTKEER